MKFTKIDYITWHRREIHEYFSGSTIYVTVKVDITDFLKNTKNRGIRFYPALIHCVATVVNSREDYRYGKDSDGNIGLWERIDPLYTVPRRDGSNLFSMGITRYREDFGEFYRSFLEDSRQAEECGKLFAVDAPPPNLMGITAFFTKFDSFSFGGGGEKQDFTPFTVIGKYGEENGKVMLPVCGEFSHSVNDGYHISQFFDLLQEEVRRF